ncbi:MAG TPA: prevent-host-death protein [Lentisphaeria bacterium]|nr:MAG: prevent-host-death protein [Lentisphaerae bacterium GWF2_50_93]HCE45513.1 prevent-host-death protein [Lentisphaeria bacterium]
MTTLSATVARKGFFDLVKGAANGHKTYRIQHRAGTAVLMSGDDYESLLETLELMSTPGFKESIKKSIQEMKKGETFSIDQVLGANK